MLVEHVGENAKAIEAFAPETMELLIPKFSGAWFFSILRWFVVRIVQSRPERSRRRNPFKVGLAPR